jgi:pimeloyl-ACP methyl ester carboxylesterase
LRLNGVDTYYELTGQGEDNVVVLHGWGGSIAVFSPVITHLEKKHRVLALDFPGHGKSGMPSGDWGVREYMEHLLDLTKKLKMSSFSIVCHSFGGRVATMLAAEHPDIVDKIVFTDAAGVKPRRRLKYYARVYCYKALKWAASQKAVSGLLKVFGVDAQSRIKNAGSEDYRALSDVMKRVFINVVNEDLTPYLDKIKAPSLLIWGDKDEDTPLYMAKVMEKRIPDAGLVIFEGAGHYSYLDDLPRYLAILDSFLN